jgi:hypothetical protein
MATAALSPFRVSRVAFLQSISSRPAQEQFDLLMKWHRENQVEVIANRVAEHTSPLYLRMPIADDPGSPEDLSLAADIEAAAKEIRKGWTDAQFVSRSRALSRREMFQVSAHLMTR